MKDFLDIVTFGREPVSHPCPQHAPPRVTCRTDATRRVAVFGTLGSVAAHMLKFGARGRFLRPEGRYGRISVAKRVNASAHQRRMPGRVEALGRTLRAAKGIAVQPRR